MSIQSSVARSVELVLKGTRRRIDLRVTDTDGELVDPTELSVVITNKGDSVIYEDDFFDPPAVPGVTRIVRVSQGVYYFPLGDQTLFPLEVGGPANMETASAQKLAVVWHVALGTGESANPVQVVQIVTTTTLMRVQQLRLRVDKAAKDIDEDPDDPCYLGYTDAMLVDFLSGGLGIINGLQPQVGWTSIDYFPSMHERILLDAAIIDTLTSQEVFAVDTDTLNFCFVEGTPVTMADGTTKPIEQVSVGDRVTARTGSIETVEAAWCDGEPEEVVNITLWGGRKFTATKEHEWPVWSWQRNCLCGCGKEVPQGKIFSRGHHTRVKDYTTKHVRGSNIEGTPSRQIALEGYDPLKRLSSSELIKGDFLLVPRKYEERVTDVTVDDALMLGYYAAEGHIGHKNVKGEARGLVWTFCDDELNTWVRDIQEYASSNKFGVTITRDKNSRAIYVKTRNNHGKSRAALRLATLAQSHVGEFSLEKRLSEDLMHWPKEQKLAFITGLFRGDGHQSWSLQKDKTSSTANSFGVWYSTSSSFLAEQVHLLLAQLGYPSSVIVEETGTSEWNGKEYPNAKAYKIKVPSSYAYDLADLIWSEQSIAQQHVRQGREGWSSPRPECMMDDDFVYVPIKKVETVSNSIGMKVYNLTVSGDHSYLVSNVATFNSDQGNSFNLDHQSRLSSILAATWTRFVPTAVAMKKQYLRSGTVRVDFPLNARFQQLVSSAPSGAFFRGFHGVM